MSLADDAEAALERLVATLPGGGEHRPGQVELTRAVADAITASEHLIGQAGTGTGKSLAYLVPTLLSGRTVVVATATKALQDQLADKDVPMVIDGLGLDATHAVLKGRSNYLCRQRLAELDSPDTQLALSGVDGGPDGRLDDEVLDTIVTWAALTRTGDRAELPVEPDAATWGAVSVGPRECPGRSRCAHGANCFAEKARDRAAEAELVVVNLHLYALHLASDGGILPAHDVVVIDEAHQLEDVVAAATGFELTAGRLQALRRSVGAILADDDLTSRLAAVADDLADELSGRPEGRVDVTDDEALARVVASVRQRVEAAHAGVMGLPDSGPADTVARRNRAIQAAAAVLVDVDRLVSPPADDVTWIEGPPGRRVLRTASLAVDELLSDRLWAEHTAVLTSATIPPRLADRVGLADHPHRSLDVGSPFDYEQHALLYCAAHLPDVRDAGFLDAAVDEIEALIVAAGGRTLGLFTSYRTMRAVAEHLRPRLPWPVLTQDDKPKPALVAEFAADHEATLLATMGFWQGIDVPGPSLSLVIIDRLPFARPDDPLLGARRDRVGAAAFREIDVPRAATLLAQGAGRLVRTATDRGVVAVLDRRLATARSYRWDIVSTLPPMRRTKDRVEVETYLRTLRDE